VSSVEAGRGKPAPDVYLAAAADLRVPAAAAAAVEDSANGMLAALAAGMALIAIPNPPGAVDGEVLARAGIVLDAVADLTPAAVEAAHANRKGDG
jgi:beta-phosphoglucomutase-like phosphatase (HAD superfamily)